MGITFPDVHHTSKVEAIDFRNALSLTTLIVGFQVPSYASACAMSVTFSPFNKIRPSCLR
jgi:hypothetical protein